MSKYRRIILVGKGASGKDHARKILSDEGLEYGVSYTTRKPREGEVNGVDYHFLSDEEFRGMISSDEWYEYVDFNGWLYGTTKEQFYDTCNVFIMTPAGLAHLAKEDRDESFVIYFEIKEEIRRERLSNRKGYNDDIERRIAADEADFKDYWNYNYMITNPLYSKEELMTIVTRELGLDKTEAHGQTMEQ